MSDTDDSGKPDSPRPANPFDKEVPGEQPAPQVPPPYVAPEEQRTEARHEPEILVGAGDTTTGHTKRVVRRHRPPDQRQVKGKKRRITWFAAVTSLLFVALLGGLVYTGYKLSLQITGGSADQITDEEAPGYVAPIRASPADLFVVTDDEGAFSTAMLVVPDSAGSGGTVVPLPGELAFAAHEERPAVYLQDLYRDQGLEAVQERLGLSLGFRVSSAETVPAEAVTQMAQGEPVVIDNIDNVIEADEAGNEVLRYRSGELSLAPEEVTEFLGLKGAGEPIPNQALRSQSVWEELLARNQGADLSGLPAGPVSENSESQGFGAAMTALLGGEYRLDQLPYEQLSIPEGYVVAWTPSAEGLSTFVVRVVQMPESPAPGVRQSTALLNGTKESSLLTPSAQKIVASGASVVLVGNADSFDVEVTEVTYSGAAAAPQAAAIAAEFGVTATEDDDLPEGVSIRVIMGSDAIAEESSGGEG